MTNKNPVKRIVLLIPMLMLALWVSAQKFQTHKVKEGETVGSIAKLYRMTPYDVLRLNPEAKDNLRAGMNLVLPTAAINSVEEEERVVGRYITHRVRRKETLYGIARQYGVTEDDIKRYNKELYKKPLRKRMKLRIPVFKVATVEEPGEEETPRDSIATITYVVKPKETLWSIAHTNGLTLKELRMINPQLGEMLKIGDRLLLPKINKEEAVVRADTGYVQYEVKPQETIYSLTHRFQISDSSMIELNPALVDGLKAGMTLTLPRPPVQDINASNYVFYEVRPKQTIYSLTRRLGIAEEELERLNPELKEGLKAGMVLKLPISQASDLDVRNSLVVERVNLMDSIPLSTSVNLVLMLPFKAKEVEVDSIEETAIKLYKRNFLTVSLDFYSGAKVAMEVARERGISVNAKLFDTENNALKIDRFLSDHDFSSVDVVIGPLVPDNVEQVARRLSLDSIPVVSPLSNRDLSPLPNTIQAIAVESFHRDKMLVFLETYHKDKNFFVIADEKHQNEKALLMRLLPNAVAKDPHEGSFIKPEDFHDYFPPPEEGEEKGEEVMETVEEEELEEYWVVLETDDLGLLTSAVSVMSSFITEKRTLVLCTTYRGSVYDNDNVSNTALANLNFYFPSTKQPLRTTDYLNFVEKYRNTFGTMPSEEAIQGFDVTLDMIVRLAVADSAYFTTFGLGQSEYFRNKFYYSKKPLGGYMNTAVGIIKYQGLQLIEIQR